MGRGTVFVIEDDAMLCDILRDELRDAGWNAVGFTCPLEALAEIDASRPKVLVVDYTLPHMSGEELVSQVRSRLPTSAIILMTGNPAAIDGAGSSNEVEVLPKPFTIQRLLALLEERGGKEAG